VDPFSRVILVFCLDCVFCCVLVWLIESHKLQLGDITFTLLNEDQFE